MIIHYSTIVFGVNCSLKMQMFLKLHMILKVMHLRHNVNSSAARRCCGILMPLFKYA